MNQLKHLGLIIDGNGRWGKLNASSRLEGYRAGLKALRDVIDFLALETEVEYLTVYAFSKENQSRPEEEKKAIFKEIESFIDNHPENIAISFIGSLDNLPKSIAEKIENFENKDEYYDLAVNIAVGYGGRDDIVNASLALFNEAIVSISSDADASEIENILSDIFTEENFSKKLSTRNLPPPDLIIRSGGEKRLSNFLLFESAYSELYFIDKLWPDVTRDDILEALRDYYSRTRHFGR